MTRSVREMSAARWRSPDRKTSIAPRNLPSNMSAMRRVSRVAFASATLAVSSAPGWKIDDEACRGGFKMR